MATEQNNKIVASNSNLELYSIAVTFLLFTKRTKLIILKESFEKIKYVSSSATYQDNTTDLTDNTSLYGGKHTDEHKYAAKRHTIYIN